MSSGPLGSNSSWLEGSTLWEYQLVPSSEGAKLEMSVAVMLPESFLLFYFFALV